MSKKSKAQRWCESRQPADRTCCYCRRQLIFVIGQPAGSSATVDHWVPRCRLGPRLPGSNEVLACARCNGAKGDMTGDEFVHFLGTGEILPSYVNWIAEKIRRQMHRPSTPNMVLRGGFWVER